jgi:D-glycero-D-manno-heptose 1,7-bisphosphate phosphatase
VRKQNQMLELSRPAGLPLDAQGVWCEILRRPARNRPALFLDRDGAVVEETGYLCRIEDVHVIAGAAEVISAANQRNVPVVMITNQSGIGRGYYDWSAFRSVQDAIIATLYSAGATLDAVYACAHHPQAQGPLAHPDHPARKPNPGMLLQAARDLALDLKSSWLIGDKANDIEAAKRAGIAGALQVATGYGAAEREHAAGLTGPNFELRFGESIADAMTLPLLATEDVV